MCRDLVWRTRRDARAAKMVRQRMPHALDCGHVMAIQSIDARGLFLAHVREPTGGIRAAMSARKEAHAIHVKRL